MFLQLVDDVEIDSTDMAQDYYPRVAHIVIFTFGDEVECELSLDFSGKCVTNFDRMCCNVFNCLYHLKFNKFVFVIS